MSEKVRVVLRRQMTPREIVDGQFSPLAKGVELVLSKLDKSHEGLADAVREALRAARQTAVEFAAEAGAEVGEAADLLVARGNAGTIVRYVDRHLERQIPFLDVPEEARKTILEAARGAMRRIDPEGDIEAQIHENARAIIASLDLRSREWFTPQLETILRESIWLDGRIPCEDGQWVLGRGREILRHMSRAWAPDPGRMSDTFENHI